MTRRWKVLIAALVFYIVGSGPAWAAEPTSPDGLSGLFGMPDLRGGNGGTLFEDVDDPQYGLYSDLGRTDFGNQTSQIIYWPLHVAATMCVRLAVGLTWWLNTLTQTDVGITQLGDSLEAATSELNTWLLPTALAIGLIVAYARSRSGREALSQVLWTLGLGIAAVAVATSGSQILDTVDDARQLLSTTAAKAGSDTITGSQVPFKWEGTDLSGGDEAANVARASGDAVWRSFAVVPWCQAQFGSQEACQRYGADWLKLNGEDEREDYIEKVIQKQEGGDDAETVKFIKGEMGGERIVIALFALITGIAVLFVIGGLALLALMPWVTAVLLAYLASVFLAALAIPGRVRQIGLDFINLLGGLTLLSALTTGILTGALMAVNAATSVAGAQGWLPSAILTMAILLGAWQARSLLERILFVSAAGSTRGGMMAAMLGIAATKRLVSGARGLLGGGRAGGRAGGQGSQRGGRSTSGGKTTPGGGRGRFFPSRTDRTPRAEARGSNVRQHQRTGETTSGREYQRGAPHGRGTEGAAVDEGGQPSQTGQPSTSGGFYARSRRVSRTADQARARERLQQRRGQGSTPQAGGYRSRYAQPTPKSEHTQPKVAPSTEQRIKDRRAARSYGSDQTKEPAAAQRAGRSHEQKQPEQPQRRRFSRERRRREGQE